MIDRRTEAERKIDGFFHSYLGMHGEGSDLVGKNVEYDHGYTGKVDVLRVDVDERYAEFIEVDTGSFRSTGAYRSLASHIQGLEDDWTYMLDDPGISVEDGPPLDGELYYRDDALERLQGEVFQEFSREVFGHDILSRHDRIDPGTLDF